jgi:hypothetical protein
MARKSRTFILETFILETSAIFVRRTLPLPFVRRNDGSVTE